MVTRAQNDKGEVVRMWNKKRMGRMWDTVAAGNRIEQKGKRQEVGKVLEESKAIDGDDVSMDGRRDEEDRRKLKQRH